ncbi:hypothetical protein CEP88_00435 (plasmid) [Roseobacter denitrificans]|uniref:Uncharacterized protein n=1 Tax=Roseobacter denitrificans (strain ATCC 33942 / OCh 114) TaxID=375451 RepID=Q07GM7_ROSDO|nr:hypothetical protein [Roseobacter denitrificans]ABI93372.1 hypothetical protein RD1_A0073 [Roseobacter denitrificans OCh 114]AVL51257.1 hypothetical protein CEP88_00435 [Roseobacter denitrificans]SFG47306.1 hypothetical protein SAMN05443635_1214 [Roseobacter denitrificans OCh 114]
MAFENNTNLGRVDTILKTLRLIEKSAASNRATDAQIRAVLAPLLEALARYRAANDAPENTSPVATLEDTLTAGQRAALHLADRASTRDLIAALLGRLEAQQARIDTTDNGRAS